MAKTREKLRKCTIYALNVSGHLFRYEEVRFVSGEIVPEWAQYTDVPRVVFLHARKRRAVYFQRDMPESRYLLVLAGSDHPEPAWHPAYDIRVFDALINEHIARTGAEILFDCRAYVYDEAFVRKTAHLN
jgi:hypothetical protein